MNFKSFFLNVIIVIVLLFGYHFLFNTKKNIAYVDTARLMAQYKGMEDVKKMIEVKAKAWQSKMDTLTQEIERDIKKYEKERAHMSDREKKTTEELIGRKQEQFMQFKQASQNKEVQEEQKITSDALVKINEAIAEYGKANNYTIIFGTTSGNIVYANDAINITDVIVQLLNSRYDQNKK